MSFIKIIESLNVHQNLSDEPNIDDGLSADELKAKFDEPINKLKEAFNGLVEALSDKREGYEASNNISAKKMYDTDESEGNIQAKLEHLKELIDGAIVGNIPDNSIPKEKLTFGNTIPTNEQMGIVYLPSKYITATNSGVKPTEYSSPLLTIENKQNYIITLLSHYGDVANNLDIYTMIGGDGTQDIAGRGSGSNRFELLIECPNYIKVSHFTIKIGLSGEPIARVILLGSLDGIAYEEISRREAYTGGNWNITSNLNKYFKYFKIQATRGNSSSNIYVSNNIHIYGEEITNITNSNVLSIITSGNANLIEYENGQIIKLKTPADYTSGTNINATLNINSIGAKELPRDLEPNKRYSLVYDGEKFIHESEVQNG